MRPVRRSRPPRARAAASWSSTTTSTPRRLIAAALEAVGHETHAAFDGPAALSIAAAFRPDVALLDLGLPVMDGFELARQLRDLTVTGAPPALVAVTGYGQASDRERTESAGFHAHVVKPVDVHELVTLLDSLLTDRAIASVGSDLGSDQGQTNWSDPESPGLTPTLSWGRGSGTPICRRRGRGRRGTRPPVAA